MGQARIFLGQWSDDTNPGIHPNTAVVGGSGSVDDDSQSSWVSLRAEEIPPGLVGKSSFEWDAPNVVPDMPAYDDVQAHTLSVHARHARTEWPPEYDGVIEYEQWRFQINGFTSSTVSLFFLAHDVLETVTPTGGAFGSGPYTIPESLWNDFRANNVSFNAIIDRPNFRYPPDFTVNLPDGSKSEIEVYQIDLLVSWTTAGVIPARRLFPRTDGHGIGIGRIWPAPNTPQAGRGIGPGAPY